MGTDCLALIPGWMFGCRQGDLACSKGERQFVDDWTLENVVRPSIRQCNIGCSELASATQRNA